MKTTPQSIKAATQICRLAFLNISEDTVKSNINFCAKIISKEMLPETTQEKLNEAEKLLREIHAEPDGPRLIQELLGTMPVRVTPTRHPTLVTK